LTGLLLECGLISHNISTRVAYITELSVTCACVYIFFFYTVCFEALSLQSINFHTHTHTHTHTLKDIQLYRSFNNIKGCVTFMSITLA